MGKVHWERRAIGHGPVRCCAPKVAMASGNLCAPCWNAEAVSSSGCRSASAASRGCSVRPRYEVWNCRACWGCSSHSIGRRSQQQAHHEPPGFATACRHLRARVSTWFEPALRSRRVSTTSPRFRLLGLVNRNREAARAPTSACRVIGARAVFFRIYYDRKTGNIGDVIFPFPCCLVQLPAARVASSSIAMIRK